ncbi:MAG: NAD(P)H-hydrate dehydratase, partial [Acidobacteria bacterium]|nr:NAD(P)H-hydrate dehydratase [Acidobacteriota bacterium]
EEIVADRIGSATEAAKRSGCVVVLKGHQTLIASPDGKVRVNPTGNPGMATGGMGDVLGGMIATLLAQGHDAADAAAAAVWLHGSAADQLAEETSDIGLAALDVAESIPRAIGRLRH